MIDTVKMYSSIDDDLADFIVAKSTVKTSYNNLTKQVYYTITSDSLEGSYSSSISARVDNAGRYGREGFVLIIEGSYHKATKGQNAYDGFRDISLVCEGLISLVEENYSISLPKVSSWVILRVDISAVYDLGTNAQVQKYINNLSQCKFPRRQSFFRDNESVYVPSRICTLKIYNKLAEFKKNDLKRLRTTDFDIITHMSKINGFVRFEAELKKRKLLEFSADGKYTYCSELNYDDLKKMWEAEFMKLLKMYKTPMKKITSHNQARDLLFSIFTRRKANTLFSFMLAYIIDKESVRDNMSKATYYRNIKELKMAGIDVSQSLDITVDFNNEIIDFDPFSAQEVI